MTQPNRPANLTAVPEDKRRPMTKTETGAFIVCQLKQATPVPPAELPQAVLALDIFKPEAFESYFEAQVLLKRLTLTNALYDPGMVALACIMSDRAGVSVMWAYTLFRRGQELGRPYTISDFTDDFPMGPPTAEGLLEMWDAQKCEPGTKGHSILGPYDTDNLLDTPAAWQAEETADA